MLACFEWGNDMQRALLSVMFSLLAVWGASAEERGESCVGIENDIGRLQCFDAEFANSQTNESSEVTFETVPLSTTENASVASCRSMTLDDLRLDADRLVGQCVTVSGRIMSMGSITMLSDGMMDMSPVYVEADALPREQRKILLQCDMGCRMNVTGTIEEVMFEKGIRASNITR